MTRIDERLRRLAGPNVGVPSMLAPDVTDESWRDRAACSEWYDPELFFIDTDDAVTEAKAVCAACPVRAVCLSWALATKQQHGVWGGLSETDRDELRRERWLASRRERRNSTKVSAAS